MVKNLFDFTDTTNKIIGDFNKSLLDSTVGRLNEYIKDLLSELQTILIISGSVLAGCTLICCLGIGLIVFVAIKTAKKKSETEKKKNGESLRLYTI
jgi:hypothetical protein